MFDRLSGERDASWIMSALRRRWWLIALVAVVAAAAAHVLAGRQEKKYSATSALVFQETSLAQELSAKQIISNADPTRQAATNQSLIELPTVSRMVASHLQIPTGLVESEVSFGSDLNSDVLPITVTDPSPRLAARIANLYVEDFIQFRKQAHEDQLNTAYALISTKLQAIPPSQQNGEVAQQLKSDLTELEVLNSSQTGDAQVVATATPPGSPSSPNVSKDTLLGLLLGVLLGCALATVFERRDRRIKTPAEVEQIYGVAVIGTVPQSAALRKGRIGSGHEEEAFLMMRAQLRYFDVDRHLKRVLVTSAETGEGKSLISLNLSLAAARADDQRALLIEADLRRPSLHRMIGHESGAGLAELLSHSQDLETGLRELVVTLDDIEDNGRPLKLDILLAGSIPPNPVELLESQRMAQLLEQVDAMYDIVIIDTPPIGVISDAIPLVHQVDGLLVITRMLYSRRDHATRLMKRLEGLNAHVLGVVINSVQRTGDAGYGYYGHYPQPGGNGSPRRALRGRKRSIRSH
jgi:capsular exopolysaccharide synthesis family protein